MFFFKQSKNIFPCIDFLHLFYIYYMHFNLHFICMYASVCIYTYIKIKK